MPAAFCSNGGLRLRRGSGVHDYANREWNGLLAFYRERWAAYFATLADAMGKDEPPKAIDWFAMDQAWARKKKVYAVEPLSDPYAVVRVAIAELS